MSERLLHLQGQAGEGLLEAGMEVMTKPFKLEAMAWRIQDMLSQT
jgi:hypothetical protein